MPRRFKLGRIAAPLAPDVPRYGSILEPSEIPASADWYSKVEEWPMLLNDVVGDCTIAAAGHIAEQWRVYADGQWPTMTDFEAEVAYADATGYDPADPATDRGATCQAILDYWRTHGIMAGSRMTRLTRYAALDITTGREICHAVSVFGSVYLGLDLPESAETAVEQAMPGTMPVWGLAPGSDVLGGHCVPAVGFDERGLFVVSWGIVVRMKWQFWMQYGREAFAPISDAWTPKPIA